MISNTAVVKKWGPVLEDALKIPKEHLEKVSKWVDAYVINVEFEMRNNRDKHHEMFIPRNIDRPQVFENLLPLNLQVIGRIKDLNKVGLVVDPIFPKLVMKNGEAVISKESIDTLKYQIKIKNEDFGDICSGYGMDVVKLTEDLLIETIVNDINRKIDEGSEVFIYVPISRIFVQKEFAPEKFDKHTIITFESRMKVFNKKTTISLED
jgi:hypothetical protein